ncbi:MAG TPA: type II secretion system protein [Geminicoccaceae bacterium]|nr:type II secretion system protein [Geminicoccaceae bacterium]
MSPIPEPGPAAGFTLLEGLVALGVLALVLTAVLQLFGSGARAVDRRHVELRLALVAESLLERARLDLDPAAGELTGSYPDGLTWRIGREPYVEPNARRETPGRRGGRQVDPSRKRDGEDTGAALPGSPAARDTERADDELWRIRVAVEDPNGHRFELDTLRLVERRRGARP